MVLLVILWAFTALLCFVQNQEQIEQLTIGKALFVYIMFIIFGPCFVITNVLESIFAWLGWEGNDDDGYGV